MLAGKDTVSIQPPTLGLKRTILGIGWWREYDLNQVRNLRVWASNRRRAGIEVGRIAFDYGFKTFRFGDGVESAEAEEIVRELKRHSSIA